MEWKYQLSVFIFRRDLRLTDNTGLIACMSNSKYVIPLFICTPTQISNQNKYKSSNAIQFMIESLYDLDKQIHNAKTGCGLWITYGDEIPILKKIYLKIPYDAIYINEDYTPYSITRDNHINKFCQSQTIQFHSYTDILLTDTLYTKTLNGTAYRIFTQYYKASLKIPIKKPTPNHLDNFKPLITNFSTWKIKKIDAYLLSKKFYQLNPLLAIPGSRSNGLQILSKLAKFKTYEQTHNQMIIPTTHLSPHNKFGTVSIREVYFAFKSKAKSEALTRQLYWRDFYYYIGVHFSKEFFHYQHLRIQSLDKIPWERNRSIY